MFRPQRCGQKRGVLTVHSDWLPIQSEATTGWPKSAFLHVSVSLTCLWNSWCVCVDVVCNHSHFDIFVCVNIVPGWDFVF